MALGAALAQPVQVVAGEDLTAWRDLQRQGLAGEDPVEALRDFVRAYPTSPLAEVAWSRLVDLGAHEGEWTRGDGLRSHLARLEASRLQHRRDLERSPTAVAVVTLSPEGATVAERSHSWGLAMHAGGGWDGRELFGAFGLRAMFGPVGGVVRAGADGAAFAEVALRGEAPLWAAPHLELAADTLGRHALRAGLRLVLEEDFWLEAAAGAVRDDLGLAPALRLELVHPI